MTILLGAVTVSLGLLSAGCGANPDIEVIREAGHGARPSIGGLNIGEMATEKHILYAAAKIKVQPPAEVADADRDSQKNDAWIDGLREQGGRYAVQAGDTLERIAQRRYGSVHFAAVVARVNKVTEPTRLKQGTILSLPDLADVPTAAGNRTDMMDLVEAKASYDLAFAALWALPSRSRARITKDTLPDGVAPELRAALLRLSSLQARSEGDNQVKTAIRILQNMLDGRLDGYGYDLDDVYRRLALAILRRLQ